jgi:hypothetical protein
MFNVDEFEARLHEYHLKKMNLSENSNKNQQVKIEVTL